MKDNNFTHLNEQGNPEMVDVSEKGITQRVAIAKALIQLDAGIMKHFSNDEIQSKKGPVFQTAILAGIMATKQTSQLIPLCHPLVINKADIKIIPLMDNLIEVTCTVKSEGKTGVEMEALTGASIAALTIYDMCKAMSHDLIIKEIKLVKKTGGKSDFERA